jgi:hypothetical protein
MRNSTAARRKRQLVAAFSFSGPFPFLLCFHDQKLCPLESINYETLFHEVLSFDIYANLMGGGGLPTICQANLGSTQGPQ